MSSGTGLLNPYTSAAEIPEVPVVDRDHVDIHRRVARCRQHSSASRANRVGVRGVCNDWRRHALGQDPFWTKQRSGVREAVVPLGLRREENGSRPCRPV